MAIATSNFPASFNLTDLNGNNGFTISGIAYGMAGYSVSSARDINGDHLNDLIISSPSSSVQSTAATSQQK